VIVRREAIENKNNEIIALALSLASAVLKQHTKHDEASNATTVYNWERLITLSNRIFEVNAEREQI
jgi:hypothetical protein